jgi:beta-phosphoglucomutase-like phosphatase (HAD superfamily)
MLAEFSSVKFIHTSPGSMTNKIQLIIFDLDGVLMDSRELHYEALNRALKDIDEKYVISLEEHLAKYDGRPTTAKLNMLTAEKKLPKELHNQVWKSKQDKTFEVINDSYKYDNRLRSVLAGLKDRGYTLYCASNSIYKTLQLMLLRKGLLEYFDFILSCEDVLHPKVTSHLSGSASNLFVCSHFPMCT